MENHFNSIPAIARHLTSHPKVLQYNIPLGYTAGYPMLCVKDGAPCATFPVLKYEMTGHVDRTRVFPPRYAVTFCLDTWNVVSFEDLTYNPRFRQIDFNRPVGYFRHAAIRHLDRKDFEKVRAVLFDLISEAGEALKTEVCRGAVDAVALVTAVHSTDMVRLCELYNMLLEPSVRPFYVALNPEFCSFVLMGDCEGEVGVLI